jgi:hypothetical protein
MRRDLVVLGVLGGAWLFVFGLATTTTGCSGKTKGDGGGIIGGNGSSTSGSTGTGFDIVDLDVVPTNLSDPTAPLSVTTDGNGRIGVAYCKLTAPSQYDINYVEIDPLGNVTGPRNVTHVALCGYGVSVAFDPSGNPVVAFLGEDPDGGGNLDAGTQLLDDGGFEAPTMGASFWLDQDLGVANWSGGMSGAVNLSFAAHDSDEPMCPYNVCNEGTVVGLYPAIVYSGNNAVIGYKDVHFGQFPVGDFAKSAFKAAVGTPGPPGTNGTWTHQIIILGTDDAPLDIEEGAGSNTQAALSATGVVGMLTAGDTTSTIGASTTTFWWNYQDPGGTTWGSTRWAGPEYSNVPVPQSLAADFDGGFGASWASISENGGASIYYRHSPDGHNWEALQTVLTFSVGTLDPSVAFDPVYHLPGIVFY